MSEQDFDWRAFASCQDIDFDPDNNPFFVEHQGTTYHIARMYCAGCPVVIDCLIEGVSSKDNTGMWGCMSPNERDLIRFLMIYDGLTLKQAAESIWRVQRNKHYGAKVPDVSVWKDWDA